MQASPTVHYRSSAPSQSRHVAGLDSVRLVCAAWVLFGHFRFFPLAGFVASWPRVPRLVEAALGNLFSGPAAVIVFFVISGFCIHYPFRDGKPIPLLSYYSRRYLRVLVPMGAAILLGKALGVELTLLKDSILWSLIAEEIYYLLYPA